MAASPRVKPAVLADPKAAQHQVQGACREGLSTVSKSRCAPRWAQLHGTSPRAAGHREAPWLCLTRSAQREQLHPRGGCRTQGRLLLDLGSLRRYKTTCAATGTADQQDLPATSVHAPAPCPPCWTGELLHCSRYLAPVQLGPLCLSPKAPRSPRTGSCTHPRARPSSPSPPSTTGFALQVQDHILPSQHRHPPVCSSTPEPRVSRDTTEAALKTFVCSPSPPPTHGPAPQPRLPGRRGGGTRHPSRANRKGGTPEEHCF